MRDDAIGAGRTLLLEATLTLLGWLFVIPVLGYLVFRRRDLL